MLNIKPELKERLEEMEKSEYDCQGIAEIIKEQIATDDERPDRVGRGVIAAYLKGDVDGLLVGLTGWRMESLIAMADQRAWTERGEREQGAEE